MAAAIVNEHRPKPLDATSEQPPLFDGNTRLYDVSYTRPFAQRVWILRSYKGLHDKIKLVPIDLQNRPAWYKEKVYHENKVPALEHNGKIIGESLDLIKYVDSNFEGPSLQPKDPAKKEFAGELITYSDTFNKMVFTSFKEAGPAFDHLENTLHKFNDGPFFLGHELSLAWTSSVAAPPTAGGYPYPPTPGYAGYPPQQRQSQEKTSMLKKVFKELGKFLCGCVRDAAAEAIVDNI